MTNITTDTASSAPVLTEIDMTMFPDILTRLANTIVQASTFAKEVTSLRTELTSLSADTEALRRNNVQLDETISHIRSERDTFRDRLHEKDDLCNRQIERISGLEIECKLSNERIKTLLDNLDGVKAERDEYGLKQMEAEDRAKAAEAKLAELQETMSRIFGQKPVEVPAFLPPKEPEQMPVEPRPSPSPEAVAAVAETEVPAPEPTPEGYVPFAPVERTKVYPEPKSDDWYGKAHNQETDPVTGERRWFYYADEA